MTPSRSVPATSPHTRKGRSLIALLLGTNASLPIFLVALGLTYCIIPAYLYYFRDGHIAALTLCYITILMIISIMAGSRVSFFDSRFKPNARRLYISTRSFIFLTWCLFGAFTIITFASASSIPIVSAFLGVSPEDLSQERGDFLKGREGSAIALLYLSSILTNTIVPYSIVILYIIRARYRHIFALAFFLFCISFLQKALFLNLILPLAAYLALSNRYSTRTYVSLATGSLLVLIVATFLAMGGDGVVATRTSGHYFSATYVAPSSVDYLIWRAFSVPVFTAVDTLLVHQEWLGERTLLGATSSLLAVISGVERINLERLVFEYQFGSWNEIANANAVFLVDAYVNFSWIGVIVFGVSTGIIFRWFRISQDLAFKALWPLFAFVIFSGPLIGMLLSNGFLYMLFHALFIRVGTYDSKFN